MELAHAIQDLDQFIRTARFTGYDPYDALNSELLLKLARRNRDVGVVLTQAFRFLPFNLRPLLKIPKLGNAKTMALLARAYLKLHRESGQAHYRDQALSCLAWLDVHRAAGFENACWGYSFPWCSRRHFLEREAPTVVCTSFAAHAFLDAYELTGDRSYVQIARSTCDFILRDCPRIVRDATYCFSYSPFSELPVHNANLLGVSILGRVHRHTRERHLLDAALPALQYSLDDQNPDGSWYYDGRSDRRDETIDSFHTGFVLDCLRQFQADTHADVGGALERGQRFYEQRFFDADGTPWRKIGGQYPIDVRDPAQFMVVMGRIGDLSASQSAQLEQLVQWTLGHMRDPSGYFYFQRWHRWGYSPAYLRWQAWMMWGLANVLPCLTKRSEELCESVGSQV